MKQQNLVAHRNPQSKENVRDARDEFDPAATQRFNAAMLGLRYRTTIESRWR
ncbi:DUF7386 family protein [Halorubrum salsamenti]